MALAPALGPLIGGIMQTISGYRGVFAALVTMAIVVGLLAQAGLPETRQLTTHAPIVKQRLVVQRLLTDSVVWGYGLLIGGINGALFSYYAEAPFIFMTHFGYSAVAYGWLGLVLAAASLLGALIVGRLLNRWTPEQVTGGGLIVSMVMSAGLVGAAALHQATLMIIGIFLTFLGFNITLPNALNRALVGYEQVMGSASGWFSLGYYLLVSAVTYGMSWWHNGAINRLPLYLLVLSLGMGLAFWWLIRRQH